MTPSRLGFITLALFALFAASPRRAAAQSVYVAGGGFADIKRFSDYGVNFGGDSSLDGAGPGATVRVGTILTPRWSLDLSLDIGAQTAVSATNPIVIAIYPPPPPVHLRTETRFASVGPAIAFHPSARGRVRLAYLAGISFVRGTYSTAYVAPFNSTIAPGYGRGENSTGVVLGVEADIALTRHLAVAPEFRITAFEGAGNGPGIFLIRPGTTLKWTF